MSYENQLVSHSGLELGQIRFKKQLLTESACFLVRPLATRQLENLIRTVQITAVEDRVVSWRRVERRFHKATSRVVSLHVPTVLQWPVSTIQISKLEPGSYVSLSPTVSGQLGVYGGPYLGRGDGSVPMRGARSRARPVVTIIARPTRFGLPKPEPAGVTLPFARADHRRHGQAVEGPLQIS
jgi:hypothetical protein